MIRPHAVWARCDRHEPNIIFADGDGATFVRMSNYPWCIDCVEDEGSRIRPDR